MSQMIHEPCKCSNCGKEQSYCWVITWNSVCPINPSNKCWNCENELTFDDIIAEKASELYKSTIINQKIRTKFDEIHGKEEYVCVKCGSKNTYKSSCFTIGNKEYEDNDIFCTKDMLYCEDCKYEENITNIQVHEDLGLKYIEINDEGYFLFKETENYKTLMENHTKEVEAEYERIKQEMIANGEI